jgi:predicted ester cyclase
MLESTQEEHIVVAHSQTIYYHITFDCYKRSSLLSSTKKGRRNRFYNISTRAEADRKIWQHCCSQVSIKLIGKL